MPEFARACRLPARRSCLLLGPRQTGKSTLVRGLLPRSAWSVDLLQHDECLRALDYRGAEARCYYWRTPSGAEVDLLVERHGRLRLAVEIKAKRRVGGADLSGLRLFGEAHPGVRRVVVAEVPEAFALGKIEVLPYRLFFERLPRWLR